MGRIALSVAALGLSAVFAASSPAATVEVTGANGTDGGPGATLPNFGGTGEPGGAGGAAEAVADSSDGANDALATGGVGGNGGTGGAATAGPPYYFSFGGTGGAGGAGGAATARAETTASDAVLSSADAQGGAGGNGGGGGDGLDADGSGGVGGDGGDAQADAASVATSGSAEARASAAGGDGGIGGYPFVLPNPTQPIPLGRGGLAGDAVANAHASGEASASASAVAVGGDAGTGDLSSADTTPLDGGSATAFADAVAGTGGWTEATAVATGGRAARSDGTYAGFGAGGEAQARARAFSNLEPAYASAIQYGGAGAPAWEGPLVSGPYRVGGPGGNSFMVDAVEGASASLLELNQHAIGGSGGGGARGGDASSELTASNPLGDWTMAYSQATGGAGGSFGSYPYVFFGGGGDAFASVTGTSGRSGPIAYEEFFVTAYALGGAGTGSVPIYGYAAPGGNAISVARANATADVFRISADAVSDTNGAQVTRSASSATSQGLIAQTSSTIDLSPAPLHVDRRAVSATSFNPYGAQYFEKTVPVQPLTVTVVDGLPSSDAIAWWLAGNADAQAAAASGSVLAFGSLGAREVAGDTLVAQGAFDFELDFANLEPGSELTFAFLDPDALAGGIDVLEVALYRDGAEVFAYEFTDTASALSSLDDVLFDLGEAVSGGAVGLRLDYLLDLDDSAVSTGFHFGFALLTQPVPEPSLALLAFSAMVALYFSRVATAFAQR